MTRSPGRRTLAGAFVVSIAVGLWIISPRFSIDGPSLIDDWSAIRFSPGQVVSIRSLFSDDDARFYPAWLVWRYLQWHTLGAPRHMLGPNAWSVVRLGIFVLGVGACTYLLCRRANARIGAGTAAALSAIAPLIVIATPRMAIDFARFGPQEPLLVGCIALGGALLSLGVCELVRPPEARRTGRLLALLVPGYALWVVGVYHKEISVCVLVLAPFAYLALRRPIHESVAGATKETRLLLVALGAAVLLPVAHVAIEVALIAHRGPLFYDTHVGLGPGTVRQLISYLHLMPSVTGSYVGPVLFVAVALQAAVGIVRRKPDWTALGLLTTAVVCIAWSAQTGEHPTRYYLPTFALVAVGSARAAAGIAHRLDRLAIVVTAAIVGVTVVQLRLWNADPGPLLSHAAIVLLPLAAAGLGVVLLRRGHRPAALAFASVCILVAGSARVAHDDVSAWAQDEQGAYELVQAVALARSSGCPVVQSGFDIERAHAIPVLSALIAGPPPKTPCVGRAFLVLGPASPARAAACPARDRTQVREWSLEDTPYRLVRCDDLTAAEAGQLARRSM